MTFKLFFILYALTELFISYPKVASVIWKEVITQERPELFKGPFGIRKNIVGVYSCWRVIRWSVPVCIDLGSSALKSM